MIRYQTLLSLFAGWEDEAVQGWLTSMPAVDVAAERLLHDGEQSPAGEVLFVLLKGAVDVFASSAAVQPLQRLGPGAVFGQLAAHQLELGGYRVCAAVPSTLIILSGMQARALLR